jgi:hypothetical protein
MSLSTVIESKVLYVYFRRAYALCSSFNNFHGKMRAMFYVLSDDHIGSTPKPAPGSLAEPSVQAVGGATTDESDDVVVDMEVSEGTSATSGRKAPGGLSSQLKRKSGDLFSGTSKLTKQTVTDTLQ